MLEAVFAILITLAAIVGAHLFLRSRRQAKTLHAAVLRRRNEAIALPVAAAVLATAPRTRKRSRKPTLEEYEQWLLGNASEADIRASRFQLAWLYQSGPHPRPL